MAKKPTSSAKKSTPVRRSPVPKKKAGSTPVRNSAVPKGKAKSAASTKSDPTCEQISIRAYEIWQSGQGGSEHDNWLRAERELRGI
jgi:hypothetical protein